MPKALDRGRDAGYSYTLLLWCVDGSESYVQEHYETIRQRGMGRMPWPGGGGTAPTGE